jgi:hypothetical protein
LLAACGSELSPAPVDETREPLQVGGGTTPVGVPTTTAIVGTVPLVLAPLSLVGFEFIDRTTNTTTDIARVNAHLTWPSPYDLAPSRVHFLWAPQGDFPAAERRGRRAAGLWRHVEPPARRHEDRLPRLLADRRWIRRCQSQPDELLPREIAHLFQSQRCMHCHSLGSKDLLIAHHVNNGIGGLTPSYVIETEVPPNGTQLRCADTSGCHAGLTAYSVPGKTFIQNEWMTPKFDQGIDWTGNTAYRICQKIKSRLTTPEKMKTHFFEDARIGWAVNMAKSLPTSRRSRRRLPATTTRSSTW